MVGARAPTTRRRYARSAYRCTSNQSSRGPALERISPHRGSGRRPIEHEQTLSSAFQLLGPFRTCSFSHSTPGTCFDPDTRFIHATPVGRLHWLLGDATE